MIRNRNMNRSRSRKKDHANLVIDKPSGTASLFTCLSPSPGKEQEKMAHNLVMEELLLPSCCQEQEVLARSRSKREGLVLIMSVKLGLLNQTELVGLL